MMPEAPRMLALDESTSRDDEEFVVITDLSGIHSKYFPLERSANRNMLVQTI